MSDPLFQSRLGWILALASALNVCVTLESAQHVVLDTDQVAGDSELGAVELQGECPTSGAPADGDKEPESAPPRRVVLQPEVQGAGWRLLKGGSPPRCPLRFTPRQELVAEDLLACRCEAPSVGQVSSQATSLAVVARGVQSHAPPGPARLLRLATRS